MVEAPAIRCPGRPNRGRLFRLLQCNANQRLVETGKGKSNHDTQTITAVSCWLGVLDRFRTRTGFVTANIAEDLT